ncbi:MULTISPECIES: PAS domain-containing sensor histidine kinase [unclassified Lentimicrobium]|uniref:sensor histidine kinase n=1 Tax=unclassified Lentimicrobium TaxID=2677434 RepID=UPI001556841F|nr:MULTISPECIES: ATP-binding protein [unclassified Lentimicrobium]NPD46614.1 ATP-binding protein [Lentimicrobium sp. S6]NPD83833.1 ATP-binding protein [Lentimicrobium sp. L6]
MISNTFRTSVVIRLVFIVINTFLFIWLFESHNYITSTISFVVMIIQMVLLIKYVEQTNRKLTRFFDNVKYNDFTSSFVSENKGESFNKLNESFNQVIQQFVKTRAEKEEHHNQLQTIVQHISIGIITYRTDGTIDIYNNAVKQLFKINNLKHIKELGSIDPDLPEKLLQLRQDDSKLIKIYQEDELMQLSIQATEFKKKGEEYLLVSVKNIHSELERKEIESWQKLIRVLTHEIMNSITPISSLASTVQELLPERVDHAMDEDDLDSMHQALSTISRRSSGLLGFVEVYRDLTRIPMPNFQRVVVKDLLFEAKLMLLHKTKNANIDIQIETTPENIGIMADPNLIEQVLINLLINAFHALEYQENPQIILTSRFNKNEHIIIEVADNGKGIKPDILDKIFMPFFTSKKEGSGIGLSLSRQIMHLHKGNIFVKSIQDKGSVFTLVF